jgi:hypothetical protein
MTLAAPLPPSSVRASSTEAPRFPRRWWHRAPGLRRLAAFRELLDARLREARALENPRPERFGFRLAAAVRLFLVTGFFHRWYFRVECRGIESLPAGPVILVANHGSVVRLQQATNPDSGSCGLNTRGGVQVPPFALF